MIALSLLLSVSAHADDALTEVRTDTNTSALTSSTDPDWDYIAIRRLFLYIDQSLRQRFQWTAFEQDSPSLRASVVYDASTFLHQLYVTGALRGETPDQAYWVNCEASPEDIKNGHLILLVNVAPVKAGEFVTLRLVLSVGSENNR